MGRELDEDLTKEDVKGKVIVTLLSPITKEDKIHPFHKDQIRKPRKVKLSNWLRKYISQLESCCTGDVRVFFQISDLSRGPCGMVSTWTSKICKRIA